MLRPWSWRTLLDYLAGCWCAAFTTFLGASWPLDLFSHDAALAYGAASLAVTSMTAAAIALAMALPSVLFLLIARRRGWLRWWHCILFGGLGGFGCVMLTSLSSSSAEGDQLMAELLAASGPVAGLVFWFIAVGGRQSYGFPFEEEPPTSAE